MNYPATSETVVDDQLFLTNPSSDAPFVSALQSIDTRQDRLEYYQPVHCFRLFAQDATGHFGPPAARNWQLSAARGIVIPSTGLLSILQPSRLRLPPSQPFRQGCPARAGFMRIDENNATIVRICYGSALRAWVPARARALRASTTQISLDRDHGLGSRIPGYQICVD